MIAIGFMIMFRAKLNPQTVISIENALPKIVITLILIAFSFAIAGFLIDLMYIITAIIVSILASASGLDVTEAIGTYLTAKPVKIFDLIWAGNFGNIFKIPGYLINLLGWVGWLVTGLLTSFITFLYTAPWLSTHLFSDLTKGLIPTFELNPAGLGISWDILKALISSPLSFMLSIIFGFIVAGGALLLLVVLLILLTVLLIFFRILFILLTSYLKIVLLIIFSPLMILMNALPVQSPFNFEAWLKNLIGELITFPLTIAILMVGAIIAQTSATQGLSFAPPLLFGIDSALITFLLGMGILFMTPDLIKTFKQAILPKPMPIPDAGPGVFFGGAKSGIEGGLGEVSKWGSAGMYFSPLQKVLGSFGFKYGGVQAPKPQGK
jgi:hypothetical protein